MSIAGGLVHAIRRAESVAADALQIFTKNQVQWRVPPLVDEDVRVFLEHLQKSDLRYLCAHASYLINLASPDDSTRDKGIRLLQTELERAGRLRSSCLVMHPGSGKHLPPKEAFDRLVEGLRIVLDRTSGLKITLALENTAGQGACLGRSFADIGAVMARCDGHPRLGLCVDTCHAYAAGYDLNASDGAARMVEEIRTHIGLDRLCLLHLNNSKHPCASFKDRHAHVSEGYIETQGFRRLLTMTELQGIPGIIETPKDAHTLKEDKLNLALLRDLEKS